MIGLRILWSDKSCSIISIIIAQAAGFYLASASEVLLVIERLDSQTSQTQIWRQTHRFSEKKRRKVDDVIRFYDMSAHNVIIIAVWCYDNAAILYVNVYASQDRNGR